MARRPKNLSTEEKIAFVNQQIQDKEMDLKDLKAELKGLNDQKMQEEMAALYLEIEKQGLSLEDAILKIKA